MAKSNPWSSSPELPAPTYSIAFGIEDTLVLYVTVGILSETLLTASPISGVKTVEHIAL